MTKEEAMVWAANIRALTARDEWDSTVQGAYELAANDITRAQMLIGYYTLVMEQGQLRMAALKETFPETLK